MLLMRNQNVGRQGEEEAVRFLHSQGYKIVERNFKKPQGDIDIVALDGDVLVFIEVKTRYSKAYGLAVEAVKSEPSSKTPSFTRCSIPTIQNHCASMLFLLITRMVINRL